MNATDMDATDKLTFSMETFLSEFYFISVEPYEYMNWKQKQLLPETKKVHNEIFGKGKTTICISHLVLKISVK